MGEYHECRHIDANQTVYRRRSSHDAGRLSLRADARRIDRDDPFTGGEHGYTTISIGTRAQVFVEDSGLGYCFAAETGFQIATNPDVILAPDFAFVAKDRLPDDVPKKHVPLAPDLVTETRSPSDTKREVATKTLFWLQTGVKEVWILEPEAQTLTVHRTNEPLQVLGANDILDGGVILPGFTFTLSRLFR